MFLPLATKADLLPRRAARCTRLEREAPLRRPATHGRGAARVEGTIDGRTFRRVGLGPHDRRDLLSRGLHLTLGLHGSAHAAGCAPARTGHGTPDRLSPAHGGRGVVPF